MDHHHGTLKLNKLNILFVVLKRCEAYGTMNLRVNNTHQKVYKKLPHMKETHEEYITRQAQADIKQKKSI